jgi:hypothetical protein
VIFGILVRGCGRIVGKALRYKLEGPLFDTRLSKLFLSIFLVLPAALSHRVYSASNRNEYQRQKQIFLKSRAGPVREADSFTTICEPIVYAL